MYVAYVAIETGLPRVLIIQKSEVGEGVTCENSACLM